MMSTRIVLLRYLGSGSDQLLLRYAQSGGNARLLGLIVERARATMRRSEEDFEQSNVAGASFLGPVTRDGDSRRARTGDSPKHN